MPAPIPARALAALPAGYVMEAMRAKRRELEARGVRVLDLSVGEPELPPDPIALEALRRSAEFATYNRYPPHPGTPELRAAMAAFYERRYGVAVDPNKQILPLLGTKEGIVHLAAAYADATRPVYVAEVSYPLYQLAAVLAGASLIELPGGWDHNYVPQFPAEIAVEGGIAFVGSPSNPTGAVMDGAALDRCVEDCRRRRAVFCFDAAYVEIRGSADAMLPIPRVGADCVIELHSLSKSFSLAGWRIGFAVGDPEVIGGLSRIKSVVDSGMPMPQQQALTYLLHNTTDAMLANVRAHYTKRQQQFRAVLDGLPLDVFPSDASMFCWARARRGSGRDVCAALAEHGVLAIPGDAFGSGGAQCLRFSTAVPESILPELRQRLELALR